MSKEFEKPFEQLNRDELEAGIKEYFASQQPARAPEPVLAGTEGFKPDVQTKIAEALTHDILQRPGTATKAECDWLRSALAAYIARGGDE